MTDKKEEKKCTHKKKPIKKQENPHKLTQPYKSLLLMRLRTAKKKTTGYLMEALTRMMRTGRRKTSSDNQYSVIVSDAN